MSQSPARIGTGFRPRRSTSSRASISGAMSASAGAAKGDSTASLSLNMADSPAKRKKRSQSLGGAEIQALKKQRLANNENMTEIIQSTQKKHAVAPRRSILKQTAYIHDTAHTTDLSHLSAQQPHSSAAGQQQQQQQSQQLAPNDNDDSEDDDSMGEADMDLTMMTMDEDRRKSIANRRVSFAPNTFVRTFTPDKPTAIAQAAAAAAATMSPASSSSADDSMDMATTEVTSAFAGHFAGTNVVVDPNVSYESENDDNDMSAEQSMDMAETAEITSAFAAHETSVVNAQVKRSMPRFSEVVRAEDEEDREIRRTLGLPSPKSSAFKGFKAVQPSADEAEQDEDDDDDEAMDEDGTATMDMTTALGARETTAELAPSAPSDQGVPTPSTPSARLRASLQGNSPLPPVSPRAALPSPRRLSFAPSPARSVAVKSPSRSLRQTPVKTALNSTPQRATNASVITFVNPGSVKATTASALPTNTPGGSLSLNGILAAEGSPNISVSRRSPRKSMSPLKQRSTPSRMDALIEEGDSLMSAMTADDNENDGGAALSLQEFFDQSNVGFISDVLSMTGVKVGQQSKTGTASLQRRRSVAASAAKRGAAEPPTFADLVVAGGCKSLFYQLYQNDQQRLQEDIQASLRSLAEVEQVLQYEQPAIFSQWQRGSEAQKSNLRSMFRMIKTYYFNLGRADWNEYRAANYDSIISVMEENLESLKADKAMVEETNLDQALEELRAKRDALARELEDEQRRDRQLTTCDQEELSELHAAIVEQAEQLNIQEKAIADVEQQLAPLQAKMQELEHQRARLEGDKDAIVSRLEGRAMTRSEAIRMQSDFVALQDLHGWSLRTFSAKGFVLRHMDDFDVEIMVDAGKVKTASLALCDLPPASEGSSQKVRNDLTAFLFAKLEEHASQMVAIRPSIAIQEISSLWTAARRLRREFGLVAMRYPTSSSISSDPATLHLISDIFIPSSRSTFELSFGVTGDEMFDDARHAVDPDLVLEHVAVDMVARASTEQVDVKDVVYMLRERLDNGGRNALFEACKEAEAALRS